MFLEESLWAEQPNVSIRHIESLSGNSPGPAKDVPDGPGDCANSLNAKGISNPFHLLGRGGDNGSHKVSFKRCQAEGSSSVQDNWSVALGVAFAKKGNPLGPHSGDFAVRPQVLYQFCACNQG